MHSKYIELFKEIAKTTMVTAEQVMEYDKNKNDNKGYEAAQSLRDDFTTLYEKINSKEFNGQLEKADFARLLVGTLIVANQFSDRISALKKALSGYQADIIPKLQEVVDKAKDNDEAMKIAEEKFNINEETNV